MPATHSVQTTISKNISTNEIYKYKQETFELAWVGLWKLLELDCPYVLTVRADEDDDEEGLEQFYYTVSIEYTKEGLKYENKI